MDLEKKKNLLGEAGKIPASNYPVPLEKLNLPLTPGSAIRVFCEGCGAVFGLTMEEALKLYELLPVKIPGNIESFSGYYFHAGSCPMPFCDSKEDFVRIEKIPKKD